MSIESAIENAQQKVANAYTAVENKGGTLPETQNLSNLPTAINTISTAGTVEQLNVTPSTSAQQFVPTGGVDGYNPVNVSAVTSSIDANITAGNIKDGVTILGVTGNVTELNGETRTVSITSTSGNTFTPSSGKNGITSIKVTPSNKTLSITPSKTSQTKTVPTNYSGYGTVTCSAVTSSIDSNIQAGNIKSGVTILGVTGNYTGSGGGGNVAIVQADTYSFTKQLAGEDLSDNGRVLFIIVSSTDDVLGGFIGGEDNDYSMMSFSSSGSALAGEDIIIILSTYSNSRFEYECMTSSGNRYMGKLNFTYTSPFN